MQCFELCNNHNKTDSLIFLEIASFGPVCVNTGLHKNRSDVDTALHSLQLCNNHNLQLDST